MENSQNSINELVKQLLEDTKPAPIGEKYQLFARGKHEGKKFTREKPVYGLQIEVDKVRLQSSTIDLEVKERIARRHGWGKYEVDGVLKYGKGFIGENLSEIDAVCRILELISDCPKDYNVKDMDTGEAERLINDFLLSSRA